MNRILTTIIALWSMCTMAGLPPTTLSGEQSATKPTTFTFEAPNYQGTQTSGIKSRVETGNTNLLVNPSFEHSTVTTGWTITNATASADTANQVEGKKALSLALTGALSVVQDSTINAANLVGLQGVARIKIKTSDVDGLQVCARNAGVTSTSLCINIPKDGVWKEINIPYILTATSNGIAITSTGTTGTVKLDDAFVGTSAPFQGVNGAKLVGTLKYAGTANCEWILVSPTSALTNFSADTDCPAPTVTGIVQAPATKIPAFVLPSGSPAGTYRIFANGMFYNNTSNYNLLRMSDGTNSTNGGVNYLSNSGGFGISGEITYTAALSSNTTIQVQAKTDTGNSNITATTLTDGLSFSVYYFPPESKIYSQASQDYDWTSYTPTLTNLAATSTECFHKRKGSDLYIRCKLINLTSVSAAEARIGLPSGLTIAGVSVVPTIQQVGVFTRSSAVSAGNGGTGLVLIEPSNAYFNIGFWNPSSGGLSRWNANAILNTTETASFFAGPIPISGWTDYGVIIGSFAGIEKCANDYECTDTFSAKVTDGASTTTVSNENLDWINGSCTNSALGVYACTLNSNLKDGTTSLSTVMNCTANSDDRNVIMAASMSSVSVVDVTSANRTGGAADTNFTLKCQKGTNDYKPKTAKVADPAVLIPITSPISTTNIDWSLIKVATGLYTKTLSANTTFTFSKLTAGQAINVRLTNTASNYTVTWPTVKWPGGTAPVMTTGAKSDIYSFFYDGTDIYGTYVQNY